MFQGKEWDYIILSCVRSLPKSEILETPSIGWMNAHLGSVRDYNQLNVALTRARKGLIILGMVLMTMYYYLAVKLSNRVISVLM